MAEAGRTQDQRQPRVEEDDGAAAVDHEAAGTAGGATAANDPGSEPVLYVLKLVDGSDAPAIDGDELRRLAVQGRITPQTPVRLADSRDWQTAADHVDGLEQPGAVARPQRPPADKRFYMDRKPWLGVVVVLVFFVLMFLYKLLFGGS